jgi:predicted nucleic acid-binding protein
VTVVLDASAAVRVVLNPGQVPAYTGILAAAETVLAPELIVAELANTFWKYFRAGSLSRADCEQGLRGTLALVDEFAALASLCVEAFDLALLTQKPAYDVFYLVLARRNGALLVTADESLREQARALGLRTSSCSQP